MVLYVKVSVDFQTDDRIMAAGPMAELLYLRSLAWSKKCQKDGRVPTAALPLVGLGLGDTAPLVAALVRAGLWEDADDGWRVPLPKWTKWQTTKAQVEELRAKRSAAGKKGAQSKWSEGPNPQVNGSEMASAIASAEQDPCDLSSRPSDLQTLTPICPTAPRSDVFEGGFSECWDEYPRKEARKDALRAYQARRREGVSHETLLRATRNYTADKRGVERHMLMLGKTFYGPGDRYVDFIEPPKHETIEREVVDR